MNKLWHDDVRQPPDASWAWAKTNMEAAYILGAFDIQECSLDHDLGASPEDGVYAAGASPQGTGLDLVRFMVELGIVPPNVVIHSWNGIGARNMRNALEDAGHRVLYRPYVVPGRSGLAIEQACFEEYDA